MRHPELKEAKTNRDFLLREVREAIQTISEIAQGIPISNPDYVVPYDSNGRIAYAIQDFEVSKIIMLVLQ